jgi:hypothetical protein
MRTRRPYFIVGEEVENGDGRQGKGQEEGVAGEAAAVTRGNGTAKFFGRRFERCGWRCGNALLNPCVYAPATAKTF